MYNFFALVRDDANPTRRLQVSQPLQEELTDLFDMQSASLFDSKREKIDYAAGYTCEQDEILCIRNVQIPDSLALVAQQPALCSLLNITDEIDTIKGVVATNSKAGIYLFQSFDRRRELSTRRFSIVHSRNTFRRLEEQGLILDHKLVAAIKKDVLVFESYHEAKKVLDLTEYYREATIDDLEAFYNHEKLMAEKADDLIKLADSWIRKKIALITQSKILDNYSPQEILDRAKVYKVNISLSGTGTQTKLVLPSAKKDLKDFLRFLDDDLYSSPLSGNRYMASSKRRWR